MKAYQAKDIRNVAIAGHGGRGKTTLAEAMLFLAKSTDRLGRIDSGNTVLDYGAEEKKRKNSLSSAVAYLEWKDAKVNIIDTPGQFDFAGGVSEGIRAAETALIVLASGAGVDVGTEKAFKAAQKRNIAKMFAVTRCDDNADFERTLNALKEEFGAGVCPVVVPVVEGGKVAGYADFSSGKAYAYANGKASEIAFPEDALADMRDAFVETVAGADEELMEKFFEEMTLSPEEIAKGLKAGIASGEIYPVYACSGFSTDGVDLLLNGIVASAPDATAAAEDDFTVDAAGPLAAICFKTMDDGYGGWSFFKVISGKITADAPAYNSRTEKSEKMGKLYFVKGNVKDKEEAPAIVAGDIGVVTKLMDSFKTGDTLCVAKGDTVLPGPIYPVPCFAKAIRAAKSGEEDKIAQQINKVVAEDPTVTFTLNNETHEQIVSGLGDQHLAVALSKLTVGYELSNPRVAYRETISAVYDAHGRHKKQNGGGGQFGDVWIRFEPLEGDGFEFVDEVVGGAVPKNFIPSVEKGLRKAIEKGPLSGSKVVGIKAALHDGQYHPVDSNDAAFQTAARLAFKEAMQKQNARPKILEPYGTLTVQLPGDNIGDITSDVIKRRGRPMGQDTCADDHKLQELTFDVPMGELGDFATVLRSTTIGRGSYTFEFTHYEVTPEDVANKVMEEAKKLAEEDE